MLAKAIAKGSATALNGGTATAKFVAKASEHLCLFALWHATTDQACSPAECKCCFQRRLTTHPFPSQATGTGLAVAADNEVSVGTVAIGKGAVASSDLSATADGGEVRRRKPAGRQVAWPRGSMRLGPSLRQQDAHPSPLPAPRLIAGIRAQRRLQQASQLHHRPGPPGPG
jgi:hypothetical protein